jgi:hypothetical protein
LEIALEPLRFVAHLDILGFTHAALRNETEAWGILSDFQGAIFELQNSIVIKLGGNQLRVLDRVRFVLFSDTVLGYSLSDTADDLIAMIVCCSQLFSTLLAKCVPVRGGISYGKFFFNTDQQLYFGLPFIEAHSIGESAQWLGIVVSNSVVQKYNSLSGSPDETQLPLIQWEVPQKSGGENKCWVINWPTVFQRSFTKQLPITVDDFYQAFVRMFGTFHSLDSNTQQKYINTVKFINSVLAAVNKSNKT